MKIVSHILMIIMKYDTIITIKVSRYIHMWCIKQIHALKYVKIIVKSALNKFKYFIALVSPKFESFHMIH